MKKILPVVGGMIHAVVVGGMIRVVVVGRMIRVAIKYFWVLPVILNVLYKCKLDFVSILSSSFLRVNSPKNL